MPREAVRRGLRWFDGDPKRAERAAALLSHVVSAGALALILATWPLWTPQLDFPRIPLIGALRSMPATLEVLALLIGYVALLAAFIAGSQRRLGRCALVAFAGAMMSLVLADQHRMQPWAYEFSLLALILALLPASEAIAWSRLLVVSIYFYSALYKLDWTFIESGGGQIVAGLYRLLQVHQEQAGPFQRFLAGSLACGELLLAAGFCWRRSRKAALVVSLVMHAVLLAALGPWGADNKAGVLLWNVYAMAQNIVLFALAGERAQQVEGTLGPRASPGLAPAGRPFRIAARGLIAFAVLFPLSQPWGVCDVWPAWAVYATAPERIRIFVDEADLQRLPRNLRPYVSAPRFVDERSLVRIDRWSLDATLAPLYPQNRFRLGVALALAKAAGLEQTIYVEIDSPANRWTGERTFHAITGSAAIAAELDRDRLNGFPRPFFD